MNILDQQTEYIRELKAANEDLRREPAARWISVSDKLPEDAEDFYAYRESAPVLATDGKRVLVAVRQRWMEEEFHPGWKVVGSDGYDFDGVTHWMPLPSLPNDEAEGRGL